MKPVQQQSLFTNRRHQLAVAGWIVAVLVVPLLLGNDYYLTVLNVIAINVIIVIGLNLLIGYAGQISIGHAAFFGMGAYGLALLNLNARLPLPVAIIFSLLATALAAWIIGFALLRLAGHYLVMATLGFNIVFYQVIVQGDQVTGGPAGLAGIPPLALGPLALDTDLKWYYFLWAVAVFTGILALNLVNSRLGRALRAIHDSEIAAACLGIDAARYKVRVFVLSAVLAALAGCLYASYLTFISPTTFSIFASLEYTSMVIVGGLGNIWGSIVGAVLLTSLPNLLHVFREYKDIFYGLLLILILMFLPGGGAEGIRVFYRRGARILHHARRHR